MNKVHDRYIALGGIGVILFMIVIVLCGTMTAPIPPPPVTEIYSNGTIVVNRLVVPGGKLTLIIGNSTVTLQEINGVVIMKGVEK